MKLIMKSVVFIVILVMKSVGDLFAEVYRDLSHEVGRGVNVYVNREFSHEVGRGVISMKLVMKFIVL